MQSAQEWIDHLQLEPHIEGGFYKRLYQADQQPRVITAHGARYSMTSIYYMLTESSPIGRLHLNRSDILHVFIAGSPVNYTLIHSDTGELQQYRMGNNISAYESPTLVVPGGYWKASELVIDSKTDSHSPVAHNPNSERFSLIVEAVSPGFEFDDMTLAERSTLSRRFPQHCDVIKRLTP